MLSIALVVAIHQGSSTPYDLRKIQTPVPQQPVHRYLTHDKFGREITFYVTDASSKAQLPLVVYIQGSGDGSNFVEIEGRVRPQNGFMTLYDQAKGAIRLLVVEKPGVKFLDKGSRGGVAEDATEFKKEHTLERWAEAVSAALKASKGIEGIDRKRILVAGHSEGGLVACTVAATNPDVTHVGSMAGGGVTQLYDLITLARKGAFGSGSSTDPESVVRYIVEEWRKVLKEPDSWEKSFLGHPYRRWTSFLATSPIEQLSKFRGKIYVAQGTNDSAVDVSSADCLYADLLSKGKDVTYDRIADADHGFSKSGGNPGEGWTMAMKRLVDWFLGTK